MSGTSRPSGVSFAFQLVNMFSSSRGSWPRSARRTGWPDSGVTRYWYHEMSHATVTTTSAFTPDSAAVEELRGLDHCLLRHGQPPQNGLVDDPLRRRFSRLEQRRQRPEPLAPAISDDGRGRAPLLEPAVVDGDLLA